jgi:hypothetical protein
LLVKHVHGSHASNTSMTLFVTVRVYSKKIINIIYEMGKEYIGTVLIGVNRKFCAQKGSARL